MVWNNKISGWYNCPDIAMKKKTIPKKNLRIKILELRFLKIFFFN